MNIILKATAKAAEKIAKLSSESTSILGLYQPQTPTELKRTEPTTNKKA
jgi:cyclic lactone autoinducer peptide